MNLFRALLISTVFLQMLSLTAQAGERQPSVAQRVVLVHGLALGSWSMWPLQSRLKSAGFEVISLDYDSLNRPVGEVQQQVNQQIMQCCDDSVNTHYVGYSLGGLLIRGFFADPEHLRFALQRKQVVMIGTPNNGTQVVDTFAKDTWFQWLGDTTLSLGTGSDSLPMGLPLPNFPVGIIAGNNSWGVADNILGEPSDGVVPIRSTKLPNMADFIVIHTNHTMLRYNRRVAEQTIYFLNHGQFDNPLIMHTCEAQKDCQFESL